MKNISAPQKILANRLRSQKLLPLTFWICLKMLKFLTSSVTNIQRALPKEAKDVLYDQQIVQEFDLSKQQILVTKGKTSQNDEEKKEHQEIDKKFKISGNIPKDNGFQIKIDDQIQLKPIQKFRDLVDQELSESYLLHTAFGDQLDIEYQLLFRGTEDGFTDTIFKQKCSYLPNLIIFILSEFGQVFGGFVSEILLYRNGLIEDKGAFLFQLTKKQIMFQNGKRTNALECSNDLLLAFGTLVQGYLREYIHFTRRKKINVR
eukprot:403340505